jgi:hypothetical protein
MLIGPSAPTVGRRQCLRTVGYWTQPGNAAAANGQAVKMSFSGHALMENRNGFARSTAP